MSKFVGPYIKSLKSGLFTLIVLRKMETSVEHENRLKPFRPGTHARGRAPTLLEPSRRPNMKGTGRKRTLLNHCFRLLYPALKLIPTSLLIKRLLTRLNHKRHLLYLPKRIQVQDTHKVGVKCDLANNSPVTLLNANFCCQQSRKDKPERELKRSKRINESTELAPQNKVTKFS